DGHGHRGYDDALAERQPIYRAGRSTSRPAPAYLSELGDPLEEAVHVGGVVVVHEARPHGAVGFKAECGAQLVGVVVAVPDVDAPAGEELRGLPRRAARDAEESGRRAPGRLPVQGHAAKL